VEQTVEEVKIGGGVTEVDDNEELEDDDNDDEDDDEDEDVEVDEDVLVVEVEVEDGLDVNVGWPTTNVGGNGSVDGRKSPIGHESGQLSETVRI